MPVRKQEAHRALELLEEYHAKLTRIEDRQLREAIERVITIFKSRLFQALLDIQEFYEETLLNDQKSVSQKTSESNSIAAKWEINPPIVSPSSGQYISKSHFNSNVVVPDEQVTRSTMYVRETTTTGGGGGGGSYRYQPMGGTQQQATTTEFSAKSSASPVTSPLLIRTTTTTAPGYGAYTNGTRPRTPLGSQYSPATNDSWLDSGEQVTQTRTVITSNKPVLAPASMDHREVYTPNGILYTNGNGLYTDEWEYEDVVLEKGTSGLGFSIAGGIDNPHVPNDSSVYVTKVIGGGAAAADGRLRTNDVILRVNTTDTVDVPHHVAVDALKRAGNVVKLFVKRRRTRGRSPSPVQIPSPVVMRPVTPIRAPSPTFIVAPPVTAGSYTERIELIKGNKGLGFSIAGGVGNEHVPGDAGIFVTKIIDGGAAQYDRRLRVGDRLVAVGNTRLENVSHETAVNALRSTSDRVMLLVERAGEIALATIPSAVGVASPRGGDTSFYDSSTGTATTYEQRYVPQTSGRRTPQVIKHEEMQPYKPASYSTIPRTGTPDISRAVRTVALPHGPGGLGFNIVGGENGEGIFVSYILPGGLAESTGNIFRGDQILEVNGTDLRHARHETAAQTLTNNSHHRVTMMTQYRPETLYQIENQQIKTESISPCGLLKRSDSTDITRGPRTVTLQKAPSIDLGFNVVGGESGEGIFISHVTPGGVADVSNLLFKGDQLIQVDGQNLRYANHEEASEALRRSGKRVTLVAQYKPDVLKQLDTVQPHKFSSYAPELTRAPRNLTLQKGPTGLGFNIVGGEDAQGIFISYILPGGVADLSGLLFKGDQLIQVNGEDLTLATHEMSALALKNSGPRVNIVAQYKPEEYQRFEAKIEELRNEMINQGGAPMVTGPVPVVLPVSSYPSPRKELHVRALFEYDPARDSGLPSRGLAFNYGDILHVTNASDDEWWQARRILTDRREEGYGIIPSKRRVEKRERARRKQVNFFGGRQSSMSEKHMGPKKSLSLSRKFPFMKSKETIGDESDAERLVEEPVYSYEVVEEQRLSYVRPVVILGALKDRLNEDLISEFSERYVSCVPHTSRPRKDHEMDGRDYFFVTKDDMEADIQNNLFIEAGQYNGNLYGTSVATVRALAQQGKHCILDVSGNAIKRLRMANLHPIAILIKPANWQQLIEWNRRSNDEEAQREFQKIQMIEQEFGEAFTAIITGDTPEEIYAKVREIIREQSGPVVWVPSRDQL